MKPIPNPYRKTIFVCINERPPDKTRPSCGLRGGREIAAAFKQALREGGLSKVIRMSRTRCLDICEQGPSVAVFPECAWYTEVKAEDVPEILARHVPEAQIGEAGEAGAES